MSNLKSPLEALAAFRAEKAETIEQQIASDERKRAIKALAVRVGGLAVTMGSVYLAVKLAQRSTENETSEDQTTED